MSNLLDRIKKNRENIPQKEEPKLNLRGTGLTKKLAEKDANEYKRQEKRALDADKSLIVSDAERQFQEGVEATVRSMREAQQHGKIVFDDSQLRAIAGIIHNKYSVLIGAAGTGKTTVTQQIVNELQKYIAVVKVNETYFVQAEKPDGSKIRILMKEALALRYKILTNLGPTTEQDAEDDMPGIAFAAYTGRAAQQLKRALPSLWHSSVSTIHSLLGYAPTEVEVEEIDPLTKEKVINIKLRFRPSFDNMCKLPYTVYVLDEASMIPVPLFNELVDAAPANSRFILIGDIHQLPPVYGKSVLGYAMRKWPVFELTTIHRQKEGNAIIDNAHRILNGREPEQAKNFVIIGLSRDNKVVPEAPGGMGQLQSYTLGLIKNLAARKMYDPYRDAIIVPGVNAENGNLVASDALNPHLVQMFNPEEKIDGVIVNKRMHVHTGTESRYFATRDKVMITSNINTVSPPITNGMIGIVETITLNGRYDQKRSQIETDDEPDDEALDLDMEAFSLSMENPFKDEKAEKDDEVVDQRQSSHVMTIKFENGQTYLCSTAGDYRRVVHGYAATCHKSQGGEYPNVIILCHSVNAVMLSQEWLYTAVTRARNNVFLICNDRGLAKAVKRQVIKGRTLEEKIKSYIIETGSDEEGFDKSKYPILYEPERI